MGIVFVIGAVKLQIGVPTEPHPGFFPFVDGMILIALSALFLFQAWRGRSGDSQAFGKIKGPVVVILTMVLYVTTLETLGYVITTAVLTAVVLYVLETKPRALILVSVGLALVELSALLPPAGGHATPGAADVLVRGDYGVIRKPGERVCRGHIRVEPLLLCDRGDPGHGDRRSSRPGASGDDRPAPAGDHAMEPVSAVIMLAGIFCGAMYGGSTTSILLNIPGEAASVVTCLDGYKMARKGRAGAALGISALGSFIGGSLSVLGISVMAPTLASFALKFGPPEYFCLVFLGLMMAIYLSEESVLKGLMMGALGLLLGTVGLDPVDGTPRFTLGLSRLTDGVDFVVMAMGLFGVAEILCNLEAPETREIFNTTLKGLLPTRQDWRQCGGSVLRGSFLGFFIGVLPGGGAIISSFAAYAVEKRLSKHPEEFGKGAIEGVAAPESANNAASTSSFIPLLTLGIPGNASIAMIFVALMMHGVRAGAPSAHGTSGHFLGRDRFAVHRQRPAVGAQPAPDRLVGAVAEGPLPVPGGHRRCGMRHRGLQREQRRLGRGHDGIFRRHGIRAAQVRLSGLPLYPGHDPGADAGEDAPAIPDRFRRRIS